MKVKKLFEDILENISKNATFRCMSKEEILEFRAKEIDALYKEKLAVIDFKAAIYGLNKTSTYTEWVFKRDDTSLFEGSFKIPEYFGDHIFGSKHEIGTNSEMEVGDIYYLESLTDDLQFCGLNISAARLMAAVLVDAWHNNLAGVDLRNRKPARNILNDINIILDGIKNNLSISVLNSTIIDAKNWHDDCDIWKDGMHISSKPYFLYWALDLLTHSTFNVYDVIQSGRRPGKKDKMQKSDLYDILNSDFNTLFESESDDELFIED